MIYLLVFTLGFAGDYLACRWLDHRDDGDRIRATLTAMTLATLSWVPVLLLVFIEDPLVAIADVLGSGVGAYLALSRKKEAV